MKGYIIGLAGAPNSGKDTVANMLVYINSVGLAKAKYDIWLSQRKHLAEKYKNRIVHFADPLKDCLSIIYRISREYFDDRDKKDNEWYCIKERKFIKGIEIQNSKYVQITIEMLKNDSINNWLDNYDGSNKNIIIKIRTLMQYFGTDIGRNQLGDSTWIDSTMFNAADIAETYGLCVVADMRYLNEVLAVRRHILYGEDALVSRPGTEVSSHDSDVIDIPCNENIDNSSTLMMLFYQCVRLLTKLRDRDKVGAVL